MTNIAFTMISRFKITNTLKVDFIYKKNMFQLREEHAKIVSKSKFYMF